MYTDLNVFQTARSMAEHAVQRQALVAQNIANADTPGYRTRDLEPFSSHYATSSHSSEMRSTRAAHLQDATSNGFRNRPMNDQVGAEPNGNTVSLEQEMVRAVEIKRQHDRAMAIYKSSLNVLRISLGRR